MLFYCYLNNVSKVLHHLLQKRTQAASTSLSAPKGMQKEHFWLNKQFMRVCTEHTFSV